MTSSRQSLFEVRSAVTKALIRYCECLIRHLDETEYWTTRKGDHVRVTKTGIPARVFKEQIAVQLPKPNREQHTEPRPIRVDPARAALYEEPASERRTREVLWFPEVSELKPGTRAIILGTPGGGKTFLTRDTVITAARATIGELSSQHRPITEVTVPIHLRLAALADTKRTRFVDSVLAAIARAPGSRDVLKDRAFEIWLRQHVEKSNCLLLLDALDEVTSDQDRERLRILLKSVEHAPCRIILTCRTANFSRDMIGWRKLTTYDLAPFSTSDIRRFVRQWYDGEQAASDHLEHVLDNSATLEHACRTPIVALLACIENDALTLVADTRRVDLYARVMRTMLRKRSGERAVELALEQLRRIAWELFTPRPAANLFTYGNFRTAYEAVVPIRDPRKAPEAAENLLKRLRDCRILVWAGYLEEASPSIASCTGRS